MRLRLDSSKLIIVLVTGLIVSLAHTSLYADMLSSSTPVVAGNQGSDGHKGSVNYPYSIFDNDEARIPQDVVPQLLS